jgi:hypothetical protein
MVDEKATRDRLRRRANNRVSLTPQEAGQRRPQMPRNTKPYLKVAIFCDGEDKLRNALQPIIEATAMITEDTIDRCSNAGLISLRLIDGLNALAFVARSVVAAQRAQRTHGVPCSFLIALAIDESSWDATKLSGGVDEWFLECAWQLATSTKFRSALPFADDARAYARKLCELGFRDHFKTEDLLGHIDEFRLDECDVAGILPSGHFIKELFAVGRDEAGRIQLKPAIDVREFRAMRSAAVGQVATG